MLSLPSANMYSIHFMEKSLNNKINIHFSVGTVSFDIDFYFDEAQSAYALESEISLQLLPAMLLGEDINRQNQQIDPIFLNALTDIQHIYHKWDHRYKIVDINCSPSQTAFPGTDGSKKRVATFFSGGADSFYTLLKHISEITDIIFVHGLDIPLDQIALRQETISALKEIANAFKINLVEAETNLKEQIRPYGEWGRFSHGIALVSTGLLLQKVFSKIYIPSSHDYANLFPWGTHPMLDHLWSTQQLQFIHDGAEATRLQKIKLISQSDVALKHLRVCWKNFDGAYNCCKCEKCLRTMINLYVCGKLDACTTFNKPLDPKRVAHMKLKGKNTRNFARENIAQLKNMENGKKLAAALSRALSVSLLKKTFKKSYH
jgi:hypothetical protein